MTSEDGINVGLNSIGHWLASVVSTLSPHDHFSRRSAAPLDFRAAPGMHFPIGP